MTPSKETQHPVVEPVARVLFEANMIPRVNTSQAARDKRWAVLAADDDELPWGVEAAAALAAGLRAVVEYYGGKDNLGALLPRDLWRLADDIEIMAHRSASEHLL